MLACLCPYDRLMWKTTPITLFFLLMLMPSLDPPGVLSFDWSLHNSAVIGASAFLGFLLQWSGALALGYVISAFTIGLLPIFLQKRFFFPSSDLVNFEVHDQ